MVNPVRLTSTNAKQIKSRFIHLNKTSPISLNGQLCANLEVPANLVEGCTTKSFGFDGIRPIEEILKQGFENISQDSYALIIIDDRIVER